MSSQLHFLTKKKQTNKPESIAWTKLVNFFVYREKYGKMIYANFSHCLPFDLVPVFRM